MEQRHQEELKKKNAEIMSLKAELEPIKGYLNQLRTGKLDDVLRKQTSDFVAHTQKVAISFDATTMYGKQHVALGIFDQDVKFHCVSIKEIEGKRGDQIASIMLAMIEEVDDLRGKLQCIISDRCAAQIRGNDILLDLLNRGRAEADKVFQISCNLHTSSGMDTHSSKALSPKTERTYLDLWLKHN